MRVWLLCSGFFNKREVIMSNITGSACWFLCELLCPTFYIKEIYDFGFEPEVYSFDVWIKIVVPSLPPSISLSENLKWLQVTFAHPPSKVLSFTSFFFFSHFCNSCFGSFGSCYLLYPRPLSLFPA